MQTGGGSLGQWSQLIIGHQWPSDMTVAGLEAWIENRGQIANAHDNVADLLSAAKTGPLAMQRGQTADSLVQLFDDGEQFARDVARKNGVKQSSYRSALNSVHDLREKLSNIADRYNHEINTILQSKEPAAVKVPHLLETIGRGQQEANLAAANCGADIGDAGQRILDQETSEQSFRQFASTHGIDMSQLFRARNPEELESTVSGMLGDQNGAASGSAGGGIAGVSPAMSGGSGGGASAGVSPAALGGSGGGASAGVSPAALGGSGGGASAGVSPAALGGSGGGAPAGASPAVAGGAGSSGLNPTTTTSPAVRPAGFQSTTPGLTPPGAPPPTAPAPAAPPGGLASGGLGSAGGPAPGGPPPPPSGLASGGLGSTSGPAPSAPPVQPAALASGGLGSGSGGPGPSALPSATSFSAAGHTFAAPPSMLNPANVGITPSQAPGGLNAAAFQGNIAPPSMAQPDFSRHIDAGSMSPGTGAVPPSAPMAPQVAPTPVSPTTAPTAGSGDWHSSIPAAQSPAAQAAAPSYSAPAASPAVNTSAPSNSGYMTSAPSMSAPSTSYSGGALPSYGSDLRPPTISAPAGSPTPPPAVTTPPPLSASPSTTPAAGSGSGGVGPTAVARPESAPLMSQQPAPMGIAGKAVAASAVGAVAGAASADATARNRLQRIVDAVARQEPRLAWAIGDRADDTTVLVTDLADGWIPPGIEIPSVVTLLEPERRRGDLESLLGEVKLAVNHTPDRYVPEADEPVPTSPRPRCAPDIEELGWELSSATHWRDGLPRLAHTLARAASSGTGVDPSEVELLQEQMNDIGERVLDAYPAEVDSKDVGNWQLLAAIDALIRGDKAAANYHLAWFQASMASATAQH